VPKSTTVTGSGIGTGRLPEGGDDGGVSDGGMSVDVGVSPGPGDPIAVMVGVGVSDGTVLVAVGVGVSVGTVFVAVGVKVAGSVTVVSTAGASCAWTFVPNSGCSETPSTNATAARIFNRFAVRTSIKKFLLLIAGYETWIRVGKNRKIKTNTRSRKDDCNI
jgi:hypothetical protein